MKRLILILTIVSIIAPANFGAMTYSADDYLADISYAGSGNKLLDPIYLFMNEVEGILEGTTAQDALYLSPTTAPTGAEGLIYYNDVSNAWIGYNGTSWQTFDVAGGTSLDSSYDLGSGITVDGDAVTLTTGAAVNNSALIIVHGETTNDNTAVQITNSADAANAITIDIDAQSTGRDVEGTGALWYVTGAGVGTFAGIVVGGTDITLENGGVINNTTNNEIEFIENGEELSLAFNGNTVTLATDTGITAIDWGALTTASGMTTITGDAADMTISITADAGGEDLLIQQAGSVDGSLDLRSAGTGADAIIVRASAGGIDIDSIDDMAITNTATTDADDLVITQAGASNSSLIITSGGTGTDALSLITSHASGDLKINSGDMLDIDAADDITIDLAGAAGEDFIVTNTGGSIQLVATEADAAAIVLSASTALGGIDITSNADIDITTTGAATEDITIANTGGSVNITASEADAGAILIQASAAGGDVNIDSVLGRIEIEAEEDAADALYLIADGGTTSTLTIFNDTGTAADSIELLTDLGGITATASAGAIVLNAVGATAGDVTVSAGDVMTLTSVDTKIFDGAAAETWTIEGTANDYEASIVFTDPTADVVWTFPTATAMTVSVMSSTLATNAPEIANSVTGGTNQLIFEGTADAYETILTAVDAATADATLTLANDTGGIAYIPTGSTTKDATDAALPLTHAVVIGTSDATSAWSLADGNPGQVLTVVIGTDGGEAVITPASLTGCGWATVVLTDAADGVSFMFVDATVGWVILGTFSDGTNIVAITQ